LPVNLDKIGYPGKKSAQKNDHGYCTSFTC
jgi:hypothetical protein